MYASIEFMSGELQNAMMLRRWACATAVPIFPGDVPMIADGFRENEFFPYGRLAQSIAFFSPPGIDRLYSGPNEWARQGTGFRNCRHPGGGITGWE